MQLTEEQQHVIDIVMSDPKDIISVNAVAGSGKTFLAENIIKALQPKNGFYTAFNKAIIDKSNRQFGHLVQCRTIHSLAYKMIRPSMTIRELNYNSITEKIDYASKQKIINSIRNYCQSKDLTDQLLITAQEKYECNAQELELVEKYFMDMWNNKISSTFDFILKKLHLLLCYNKVDTMYFDLLIQDEAQDITEVNWEIFKLLHAKCKIILGDEYQNIYSFMNTINAFEHIKTNYKLSLTKSFRCNDEIAKIVQEYGQEYLNNNFQFVGISHSHAIQRTAYLSRTNVQLATRMYSLMKKNKKFNLIKDPNTIFSLIDALNNIRNNKYIHDKMYSYINGIYNEYNEYIISSNKNNLKKLKKINKQLEKQELSAKLKKDLELKKILIEFNLELNISFFDYCKDHVNDNEINTAIHVIENLEQLNADIDELKKYALEMWNSKHIHDCILSTTHATKGLEFDEVYIEDDLNYCVKKSIENIKNKKSLSLEDKRSLLTVEQKENLNVYYVALSRAKYRLVNCCYNK